MPARKAETSPGGKQNQVEPLTGMEELPTRTAGEGKPRFQRGGFDWVLHTFIGSFICAVSQVTSDS